MDAASSLPVTRRSRRLMAALWPSFLMAAVLEGLVFSLLDPELLDARLSHAGLSALAVYSLAFLVFWAVTALASGLSLLLAED